jgi:CRISPR-associated protein Cmr6
MNTPNIGWLYFKDYYRINNNQVQLFQNAPRQKGEQRDRYFQSHYKVKNAIVLSKAFNAGISTQFQVLPPVEELQFTTTYPGLILGTGYIHETGELGEFKLGFFFDHATGYPCIPGSTVKGCLRSMFPQKENKEVADKKEKYNYLASVIRELTGLEGKIIERNELGEDFDQKEHPKRKKFIDMLEREIFDGEKTVLNLDGTPKEKDSKIVYQPISVYERDIFFDGYIVSSKHPAIKRSTYQNSNPFIGDDYITPHINRKKPELSPFTNPIPLMFLKILPEVTIQFQFDLKDGLLTKGQKRDLFRRMLLDFGIGAKTNVGYGQFEEGFEGWPLGDETNTETMQRNEPAPYKGRIKQNERLEAVVVDQSKKLVKAIVHGNELKLEMAVKNCPENGTLVQVKINTINKKNEILQVGFERMI